MADLANIQDVKDWLELKSATDDALLGRLLTASSRAIEKYLGRPVLQQTVTELYDGNGSCRMILPLLVDQPLVSVTSLTIDGTAIPAAATIADPGYRAYGSRIVLNGYAFCRGALNVEITYVAGWTAAPEDLAQACIDLVAYTYRNRSHIGVAAKTINTEVVSFIQKAIPDHVQRVLDTYIAPSV